MAHKKDPNEITFDELDTIDIDELGRRSSECYGFYDWFCSKSALKNKAKRLLGVARKIVRTGTKRFNPKNCYIFFCNNCPGEGGLYDDLRICDKKTGEVLINVCPAHGEIWSAENNFDKPVLEDSSIRDIYAWFKAQA